MKEEHEESKRGEEKQPGQNPNTTQILCGTDFSEF